MADITQLRFAAMLKRVFAVKADDPGRYLQPIVAPSYEVSDNYRPEDRILRGERVWGSFQSVANAVAGFSEIIVSLGATGAGTITNKMAVIRRVTFCAQLPTSVVQPGNAYFGVTIPFLSPPVVTTQANPKDGRVAPSVVGGQSSIRLGAQGAQPALALGTFAGSAVYVETVNPAAAVTPNFRVQVDNLDVILVPGTYVGIDFRSDTLPTGTYSWGVMIEGYERTTDPSELLVPPA